MTEVPVAQSSIIIRPDGKGDWDSVPNTVTTLGKTLIDHLLQCEAAVRIHGPFNGFHDDQPHPGRHR